MKKLVLVTIMALIMVACNEDCNCPNDNQKHTIDIGVIVPLSGGGSSVGEGALAALEIAGNEINAYMQSIVAYYDFNFIVKDSETDPQVALSVLKEFHQSGIRVVIGPFSSTAVAACKDFADQNDMLILSPASVSHSLSIPDDNIFRMPASDSTQAIAMSQIFQYDNQNRVIFTIMRDDVWGNDLYDLTRTSYEQIGGEMAEPIIYAPDTHDFSDALSILNDRIGEFFENSGNKKAGVYLLSYGEGMKILEKAGEYSNLSSSDIIWYGSSAFANNKDIISNPAASLFALEHSFRCPVFGLINDAEYKWSKLEKSLSNKLGRIPEVFSFLIYDALWVASLSYLQAGHDPDFSEYKKAMIKVADLYFGVTGPTSFDQNGDRMMIIYDIWQILRPEEAYSWVKVGQYEGASNTIRWF
jgi:branched-chain amino acid transport system substrate-binding protein